MTLLCFSRSVASASFVTSWTVAHQAPLSMGLSKQQYRSGLPFPSPGDLPDPGVDDTGTLLTLRCNYGMVSLLGCMLIYGSNVILEVCCKIPSKLLRGRKGAPTLAFPPLLWVLDPPDVDAPITPSTQGWKTGARPPAGSMKESWEQLKAPL